MQELVDQKTTQDDDETGDTSSAAAGNDTESKSKAKEIQDELRGSASELFFYAALIVMFLLFCAFIYYLVLRYQGKRLGPTQFVEKIKKGIEMNAILQFLFSSSIPLFLFSLAAIADRLRVPGLTTLLIYLGGFSLFALGLWSAYKARRDKVTPMFPFFFEAAVPILLMIAGTVGKVYGATTMRDVCFLLAFAWILFQAASYYTGYKTTKYIENGKEYVKSWVPGMPAMPRVQDWDPLGAIQEYFASPEVEGMSAEEKKGVVEAMSEQVGAYYDWGAETLSSFYSQALIKAGLRVDPEEIVEDVDEMRASIASGEVGQTWGEYFWSQLGYTPDSEQTKPGSQTEAER